MRYLAALALALPLALIAFLEKAAHVQASTTARASQNRLNVFQLDQGRRGMAYRPELGADGQASCLNRHGREGRNVISVKMALSLKMGYCGEFAWADFNGKDLSYGSFGSARFRNADLRGADLNGADLAGADLSEALTFGASFVGTRYDSRTVLPFSEAEALKRGMVRSEVSLASGGGSLVSLSPISRN